MVVQSGSIGIISLNLIVRIAIFVSTVIYIFVDSNNARAERYSIIATREEDNLYSIRGTSVFVVTKRCRVRARREDSLLDTSNNKIYFFDSEENCDIEYFLVPADLNIGRYSVNLTIQDNGIYEDTQSDIVIKTIYCYEYEYYSDAILDHVGSGFGTIIFIDSGSRCEFDGVFFKKRRL